MGPSSERRAEPARPDLVDDEENDDRERERDQAEQLGRGEADVETALLTVGGRGIADRALEERAEHIADADGGDADADRREAGADHFGGCEVHDDNSFGETDQCRLTASLM